MAGAAEAQGDIGFWRGREVLVTGYSGFLGSRLSEALVRSGAEVVGLARKTTQSPPVSFATVAGGVEDLGLLARCLGEHGIETVFHLSAQSIVGYARREPLPTFETNIRGTWNLLEACRHAPSVRRIVLASSDKACDARRRHLASNPYNVSKGCAELIAATYSETFEAPVCVLRCANIFGGGDLNMSRILPGTIGSVLRGERPVIRSDGSPVREYVHVLDAVNGFILLAERMDDRSLHGRVFTLSGSFLSVLELTRKILELADRRDLEPEILDEEPGQERGKAASGADPLPGWEPAASFEKRLLQTIEWYRDRL